MIRNDIVDEGPSYVVERTEGGPTLVATGPWTDELSRLLDDGRVDGLNLNYARGFQDTGLEFMSDWPLKRLDILARTIVDLDQVYRLSGSLESLSVQASSRARIDLSRLPHLARLSSSWVHIKETISSAPRLRSLSTLGYDQADLSVLWNNRELELLRFKDRPRLRRLTGIEALPGLRELGVFLAPLDDLSELAAGSMQLDELWIEACPIHDLTPLASQTGLRMLSLSECGEIDSVGPLSGLHALECLWIYGSTKILDNDLNPIAELPNLRELRMKRRRSYRPTVQAIQESLDARS
ncbi:MAG: hypothetical protein ACK5PP_07575 [Acidimicrobiales bacterium]